MQRRYGICIQIIRALLHTFDFTPALGELLRVKINSTRADMAELADALDSGSNFRKEVEVQVLLPAPNKNKTNQDCKSWFVFICNDYWGISTALNNIKSSTSQTKELTKRTNYSICNYIGEEMALNYNKLWKLLIDKGLTKTQLREKTGISQSTLSKLVKGENVNTEILDRICLSLNCDISDIVEIKEGI